ncbi:replicative DNA helicase [Jiangella mangrovi]|uniref:Replicative DNA helicase n=1 Tax=Jiangella mangrovi TaxID=1524084 RepID=A0A7W9GNW1_9ACTN|nr:replicative DNA helicase [Jiangella mangrovi]
MSVAELPDRRDEAPVDYGRTPPQDVAAEQSVLGGMLLSKDAIADVVEIIRGTDFYRPAHEAVYEAVIDLYGRGEPADAVTVAALLQKRGELGRVGGAPYLHTLVSSVPSAANAGFYAEIVRERAMLRRLVEAGTRITQMGYSDDGDADTIVDRAQAEIYAITEKRASEDYHPLSEIMEGTLDEIEAIGSRGGQMVGVPTGFTDLDALTNGLHPGQLIILAARPAVGKALALDTPLPTPTGWTTMGEVRPGDLLIGADGRPTRVVAATEVMTDRPCYEVEFSDGTVIVADAQHQWVTTTRAGRMVEASVSPGRHQSLNHSGLNGTVTTEGIAKTLRCHDGRLNHAVRLAAPFDLPDRDLPLPPYVLGLWLSGHGGENASATLRTLGLLDVGIPSEYLRASIRQRRALLAGLLDTGGLINASGVVQVFVTNRRLAEDALDLAHSLGYRTRMTTKRVNGRAEAGSTSYCITLTLPTARMVVDVRRVPSVPVRCVEVDAADHLYLAGRSCIPTHNSTLGLDLARAASIKHGLTSVVYSLEMGRNEITMRLLSAEAKVPLHHMRSGQMTDDDWNRIARSTGEVSSAPLYIDDSPNMTMMEIRAKCRRLKQRNDLRLVIIDYLQLMSSGKRVESRQQEVAEFSRALKLLAKELEVPVIAMSQLNRGPEQRQDKKPMLSDLRESGCLPASTRIMRADTGAEITIGELMASGVRDIPVWSLDDSLRYVPRTMTHAFPSGRKETFRLRLASGKQIDATANHPFLTYEGWRPLGEVSVGSRLAVPRHVPAPLLTQQWDDAEVVMLAHLIGDGSFVRRQPVRYASVDEENLAAVNEAARNFGITAIRDDYAAARVTTLRLPAPYRLAHGRRNPIAAWLDGLGLFGLRSHEKFVPDAVFGLPKKQITMFLRHLWATDGSVTVHRNGRSGRIYYASTSRRLLDGVSRLLLRYGISTRLRVATPKAGYRPQYTLDVSGRDEQLRFLREIGCHGARSAGCARLLAVLEAGTSNANVDTVPREVWQDVRSILAEQGMTHRQFAAAMNTQFGGSAMWKQAPSRERLSRVATVLGSAELEMYATNDLLWDEVVAIEPLGEQDVYDATVMGTHNFIADGVATHNSIEQDADMVILLHREDAYEKESPRAGEADFIVAKHRNGPTATITVAFQGHYSRFVDMAQ